MKLQVIVGSTRPGRATDRLAKWVVSGLQQLDGAEVELVDLQDYDLPMLNEPISPRYNPDRKPEGAVKQWLDKIGQADGYVLATPEYNRGYPAVLKNALDYIDFQMDGKPVAIAAHGSTGGAQAVASLRITIPGINAVTVPQAVYLIGFANQLLSENGELNADLAANPHGPAAALSGMAQSLQFYAQALQTARQQA